MGSQIRSSWGNLRDNEETRYSISNVSDADAADCIAMARREAAKHLATLESIVRDWTARQDAWDAKERELGIEATRLMEHRGLRLPDGYTS